jgi:hypothetical protein
MKQWQPGIEKERREYERALAIGKKLKDIDMDDKDIKKTTGLRLADIREL